MLKLDQISVFYGTALALEDVSLVLHSGQALGLIGRNGAGKSSLIKAVIGLHTALTATAGGGQYVWSVIVAGTQFTFIVVAPARAARFGLCT